MKVEQTRETAPGPPTESKAVQPENVACVPEKTDLKMDGSNLKRGMDQLPETKRLKLDENPETDNQVLPESAKLDALSDFPEEMLLHMLSMVEDGKDLHTLSNTTNQFNRILEPSKTQWAFSQVLPLIYTAMDKDDILICRLVCKKWQKAVDNFIPTVPSSRSLEPYPYQTGTAQPDYAPKYQEFLITKQFSPTKLVGSEDIRAFLDEMKGHPRNPLVLRDVCLDSNGESEEYWNEALAFLKVFGHHIWHIGIFPDLQHERRAQLSTNYRILREALTLLPNLKTLYLGGFTSSGHLIDDRMLRCLERYIQSSPLPALPKLHTFDEGLARQPNPVMNEIMRRFSGQLKHFRGRTSVWLKDDFLSSWDNLNLPQITNIEVYFEDCSTAWHAFCRKLVAPNLAKLNLIIYESCEISELLKPLKDDLPSLVYLSLKFLKKNQNFDRTAPPRFVLEKIKTLEIEDSPFVQYDQLLSHLPYLEYVLVCRKPDFRQATVTEEEGMLPIRRMFLSGVAYQSDVWTRLEFLKKVIVARMGDTEGTENEFVNKIEYTRDVYTLKSGQRK